MSVEWNWWRGVYWVGDGMAGQGMMGWAGFMAALGVIVVVAAFRICSLFWPPRFWAGDIALFCMLCHAMLSIHPSIDCLAGSNERNHKKHVNLIPFPSPISLGFLLLPSLLLSISVFPPLFHTLPAFSCQDSSTLLDEVNRRV